MNTASANDGIPGVLTSLPALISPSDNTATAKAARSTAGACIGHITRNNSRSGEAPSTRAASRSSGGVSRTTGHSTATA